MKIHGGEGTTSNAIPCCLQKLTISVLVMNGCKSI